MERYLVNSDLGSRRDPVGRIRPHNYYKEPITTYNLHEKSGPRCGQRRACKGRHVKVVVHQWSIGTGQEEDTGLKSQYEPFHLKYPHQVIQYFHNNQESHQCQKTTPLHDLHIWEVPQEAMEDQSQAPRWVNQEYLRKKIRAMNLVYQMISSQPGLII